MKIQLINYLGTKTKAFSDKFEISSLGSPKSLDEFDVNIIDLSANSGLWQNRPNSNKSIDSINDFCSIQAMVENSSRAKIVYVLPRNVRYYWFKKSIENGYYNVQPLKDNIYAICNAVLDKIFPKDIAGVKLIFENTRTDINGIMYEADFYFGQNAKSITQSIQSEKNTTAELADRIFATTLNVTEHEDELWHFLKFLFAQNEKQEIPEWLTGVNFADDVKQKEIIENSLGIIEAEQDKIDSANLKLRDNMRYKSILYTNGDELVSVVFEILEQILDCSLKEFVDLKKEDFLIKKQNGTLIGEIKGVTSNIKYEHVSQVEVHYRGYMDRLEEENKIEVIKQILIMNPFRNKDISKREPINEQQIKLAERNGCLIIETITLLKLYEKFLDKEVTVEKCIELFFDKTGLLKVEDFTT